MSLNDEIKEWKRLEDWVKLREKKLENLEKISNAEKLNKPNSIDFVNKLLNELDDDLSSYGLENYSTDSSDFIEYKSMRPMRERRRAKSVPNIWKSESDDCDKEDDFNFNPEQLKHNRFNVNSYNVNSSKRSINNRNHDMFKVPMMNLPPSKANQTMLKQQITDVNKNQQNFENIYNNHADWLISLRKELNGHTNL